MNRFRVAEPVRWAVEAAGVVLVNDATGAVITLGYPQAAVWDLLTRGDSGAKIGAKLCAIAALEPAAARALVRETAAALREAGFLILREQRG
jgi:hypothetical protein